MGLVFPKPKRSKNGSDFARQAIPADVRAEYQRLYKKGWEERWRAKAGTPTAEAKRQYADWISEINRRIETIRATQRGEGITLTHKDALALAGEWYSWFVACHEDAPGDPKRWDAEFWHLIDALREHAPDDVHEHVQRDLEWTRDPNVREGIRPVLADLGHTAQFLAWRGFALTDAARGQFLDCVLDNYTEALWLLERRAKGDYEPDERPKQFPKFAGRKVVSATGNTPWKLFEGWVAAKQPASRTVNRWIAVFRDLEKKFPDAGTVSEDDAQAWAKGLITAKRSARTVSDVWVNSARTVFAWAKGDRQIASNPFAVVKIAVPHKIKSRESDAFTADETRMILSAALQVTNTDSVFPAAKRWAPWLCAYSGARISEVTQLRGSDIRQRGAFHTMLLTPDAGSIKTRKPRTVPLHEHIIEQGFLDYVEKRGKGPLFYNPDNTDRGTVDPMNPKRARSVVAANRLAGWVRTSGVTDTEVQPNHAWRDTFKQIAERHGISERVHDTITGHSAKSIGRTYGASTPEDMAAELRKFPRYDT